MKEKKEISLAEAIAQETEPLALKTLHYTQLMKQILDSAKNNPGFSSAAWAPLAELVDVPNFNRVGTFMESVNWAEYAELLTGWSIIADWKPRVRRITEKDGVVFLELAESATYEGMGDKVENIYSCSIYEYGENGKLRHLDVHMQRKLEDMPPKESWDIQS